MNNNRRKFRVTFAAASILLTFVVFYAISVADNWHGARVDMTSDKLFTMSPAAADILKELKVPVLVKLYITDSDKMPTELRNLERDVTEQMRNFEQVADGMLEFTVHNPQDDEEMQTALGAKGIRPFQVQSIEKDEMGIKLIWSALTIAYKDKPEEVIPQLLPQRLPALEQDIIGPVYRLTRERTPRVAIFGPKKEVDQQTAMMYLQQGMQPPAPQEQFARLGELLGQGHYEAVPVELTAESPIPEDVDCLIVMAMSMLNDRQVFEINRAIRGGLPVILAVQAHEYGYSPAQAGGWNISGQSLDTGLEPMLAQFGLTVSEDHFFDSAMETIDLPREVNIGGLRMQTREPVKVPIQISVTEAQMNQDSPLTNRIGSVFFLWGTPIVKDETVLATNSLTATSLMTSSDNCWTEPWSDGPLLGDMLAVQGKNMLGAQTVAMLVEGQFPDTFEGREVPAWPAPAAPEGEALDPLAAGPLTPAPVTPQPGTMFLVGGAKMFDDNILAAQQNALLLLNAVDYLAGSHELLAIRSKTLTQRVIKPVAANQKLAWRLFAVLLVPVGLAVFGFMRAGVRRRDAAAYRSQFKRAGSSR
ncbi:MAG: GldG family protein [Candidatus Krumholzibacteria bacterium]|nr:GldG family protein [Candidatus Krumholzibacteria bacterium]